jgi:hypothetical protein
MRQKAVRIVLPTSLVLLSIVGLSAVARAAQSVGEADAANSTINQTPVTISPPIAGQAAIAFGSFGQAQERNHCNVSYTQCSTGTISCEGHSYCTSGSGWVECDGQRTYCPSSYCEAYCARTGSLACTGQSSCQNGWFAATCDGVSYECPTCPNPQEIFCE